MVSVHEPCPLVTSIRVDLTASEDEVMVAQPLKPMLESTLCKQLVIVAGYGRYRNHSWSCQDLIDIVHNKLVFFGWI